MKIAFIGQKGIPAISGGVERHVEFLATELVNLGNEVIVYNRKNYTPTVLKKYNGVRLIYKPFINNKNLANITHTFLSSLDVIFRRVDIIHYHGVGPSLLLPLVKIFTPKAKLVATLHSFDYDNEKWGKFAKLMLRLGEYLMFTLADQVIVITPATQKYAQSKYQHNSVLIPNGADMQIASSNNDFLNLWGLKKDSYILSASRLIKLKGLQYLIAAYKSQQTDKKLVIAGDGEYETELKKMANNNKNIIFVGNQEGDNLRQLYDNAYLFVQASEMEGLSLSLLEAMGHKNACLASDIVGNEEALADTGLYFQSRNVADLKEKLDYMLNHSDELKLMGEAAYKRASQEYDWHQIAISTAQMYQDLVK
ncbi:glycosyltransferase family 4 protein [Patescibacteria group bacterium]|nr:glycosyltransferase family 4 protein [Patescibacteria group bacterium]